MKLTLTLAKQEELERLMARAGVREEDLVEKFVRASGPGGQKVNKTSSAVYLKHVPTGLEVKAQSSRSQAQNRYNARRILADRLEAQLLGKKSAEAERIAKIRRQKRKRSKRSKERMLADKRAVGEKKQARTPPRRDD